MHGSRFLAAILLAGACACGIGKPERARDAVRKDPQFELTSAINLLPTRVRARTVLQLDSLTTGAVAEAPCAGNVVRIVSTDTMQFVLSRRMREKGVESMWDPRGAESPGVHWVYGVWRMAASPPPDAISLRRDAKTLMLWAMRVSVDTLPRLHALAIWAVAPSAADPKWDLEMADTTSCAAPPLRPGKVLSELQVGGWVRP